MSEVPTRQAILGVALLVTCASAGLGFFAGRSDRGTSPALAASAASSAQSPPLALNSFPRISFAQQGEDLVALELATSYKLSPATYLDIGAHHPIVSNNTFLFYGLGWRGVLVEPNPHFVKLLREERVGDVVLPVGIGVGREEEADYYEINAMDGQLNTFSKEQVDALVEASGPGIVSRVSKVRMMNINNLMKKYFPGGAPTFLSIDTEGLDLAILRSLDFDRHRPKVICAETLVIESDRVDPAIAAFLATRHYTPRGGTRVNTLFVADEVMPTEGQRVTKGSIAPPADPRRSPHEEGK